MFLVEAIDMEITFCYSDYTDAEYVHNIFYSRLERMDAEVLALCGTSKII
jgi:hypothetical protein